MLTLVGQACFCFPCRNKVRRRHRGSEEPTTTQNWTDWARGKCDDGVRDGG